MTYKSNMCRTLMAIGLIGLASFAQAECYADYKAKADNGDLQLHYGVMKISDAACADITGIADTIDTRIAANGWQLLHVMSSFDETGLTDRQANAGEYFLRY